MRFLCVRAAQHSRIPLLLSVGVRPYRAGGRPPPTVELMARITFSDVVFPAVPSSGATITLAELAEQVEWNMWYEPECGPLGAFLDRASGGAITVRGDTVTRSGHSPPAPDNPAVQIGDLRKNLAVSESALASCQAETRHVDDLPAAAPSKVHDDAAAVSTKSRFYKRRQLRQKRRRDEVKAAAERRHLQVEDRQIADSIEQRVEVDDLPPATVDEVAMHKASPAATGPKDPSERCLEF